MFLSNRNLAKEEDHKAAFSPEVYNEVEGPSNDAPPQNMYNYAVGVYSITFSK